MVYRTYMSRTDVDIDDDACAEVMRRYRLTTKREAINYALRTLAAKPLSVDEARRLRGSGWEGNLDELRADLADAAVLHRDSDFDTLARHAGLIVDRQR